MESRRLQFTEARSHSYTDNAAALVATQPSTILDVGCSTGLSTIRLHSSFPEAQVLGIDLS
eukprot:37825-Eustigmatos_ZCMA.PRE.1